MHFCKVEIVVVLLVVQGGDLMLAISNDKQNNLRWSRKGHRLAMDIAKGLVHLHTHQVNAFARALFANPCP